MSQTRAQIKSNIDANITTNGNEEITGAILRSVLDNMADNLATEYAGYQYAGVATPSTNPGTPDGKVFYLASTTGTYTNFGSLTVADGEVAVLKYNGSAWSKDVTGAATKNELNQLGQKVEQLIFDVTKENIDSPTFASLSALLSDANISTLIPISVRTGGMSIRFVQTSDNKYVQYRYMGTDALTVATFTNTDNWSFCGNDVYTDNPEFVKVYTDNEGKILWGIQKNGNVVFGAGVPQQVVEYITEKIEELSLDEYEDIVSFLNGLEAGDKTLQELLNEKVDKVTGKSLIDGDFAEAQGVIDNPEYLQVITDSEKKILQGIKSDGTSLIGGNLQVEGENIDLPNESIQLVDNDEYLKVTTDDKGKVLHGIKKDGSHYIHNVQSESINALKDETKEGLATKVNKEEGKGLSTNDYTDAEKEIVLTHDIVDNPEYIEAKTDSEGKLLAGRTPDGAAFEKIGFTTPKASIDGATIENIDDPERRTEILADSEGKVISYRKTDGTKVENVGLETNRLTLTDSGMTDFQQALRLSGFRPGGASDLSYYFSNDGDNPLHIPIPRCASLNIITDKNLTQLSKKGYNGSPVPVKGVNYDVPTQVEYYDTEGNYFKKWTLMSAQGSSSMTKRKKNLAFDFFDREVDGDAFSIKFGNWVPQDSFHLKAYMTDFFRGVAITAYGVAMDVDNNHSVLTNRNWKKAQIDASKIGDSTYDCEQIDDIITQTGGDARCMPDGFPVVVYRNGAFYGIFSWQLKKSRENYKMSKKKAKNIHLDGEISNATLFGGTIDWTKFEVRNPKNLVYAAVHDGSYKYDADVEQAEIAGNSDGSSTYDTWVAGSYAIGKIVSHNGHEFINTVADNTAEPIFNDNNADDNPDFKNKTGCGWINCTTTVAVKKSIIELSKRINQIDAAPAADRKALFDTYFDAENIYEYQLVQAVTGDYDGNWGKNWQWTTWDGTKWYVNEYDKDCSFGGNHNGTFIVPAIMTYPTLTYLGGFNASPGPQKFCNRGQLNDVYYNAKVERYKELRDARVFDPKRIVQKLVDWVSRIGVDNFEKEYEVWDDSLCNQVPLINTPWQFKKPVDAAEFNAAPDYSETASYSAGDVCKQNYVLFEIPSDYSGEAVSGIAPYIRQSHRDNIYRFEKWVEERISLLDTYTGYNQN